MGMWKKLKRRIKDMADTADQYQKASTFAQAGSREHALEFQGKKPAIHPKRAARNLLVVSPEHRFPPEMRAYALEMAQRLGYEIIALNAAPIKKETWRFLGMEQQNLRQEFKDRADAAFEVFCREAEAHSVRITHVVKFIEKEEALHEVQEEQSNIDFVISDSEQAQPDAPEEGDRPRSMQELYVYSIG